MFPCSTTTKRLWVILVGVLAALVVSPNANAINSAKIDTPVIATTGKGQISAVWSQPVGQEIANEYSLEVCHVTDCYVAHSFGRIPYTANFKAKRTSIVAFFSLTGDPNQNQPSFYTRNIGLPLTATISAGSSPSDSTRSDTSAYFYVDPPEVSPVDTTQQFMQPVLNSLSLDGLSMAVCFNRTSDAFRWRDESMWPNVGLRFPGYTLKYEISKDGAVIQSGRSNILGGGIQGNWFNGRYCEDGPEGDERWDIYSATMRGNRSANSLDPGTTYTFTYKLDDGTSAMISGSLDITTPGGCPSTPPGPPQHLVKSGWSALLDGSGYFMALFQGFSPRQSAYMSATQSANIYVSPYKTYPTDSSFIYVPEIDDFAVDMSSLITSGKYQIKDATIFKDCSPEQVQIAASIEVLPGESDASACQIVEGNVIPQRVDRCILRVRITRKASVTSSGVRKMGFTFTRTMAVNFSSMSATAPTVETTAPLTTVTTPTTKTIPSIARGKLISVGQFMKLIRATSPRGSIVQFVSTPTKGSNCAIQKARLNTKRAGTCLVRYSIVTRTKKFFKSVKIRVL